MNAPSDAYGWEIRVPMLRNPVIVRQLGLAIGVPFVLLALLLALISGQAVYALYGLGLMVAMWLLAALVILVIYGGRYEVAFELDDKGVVCRTQARQRNTNRVINGLTVVLGALAGKPALAGAGMLAQSRQQESLRWSRVRSVRYYRQSKTILLRAGWLEPLALFCTDDNYERVCEMVARQTGAQQD